MGWRMATFALFRLAQAVTPAMVERGSGTIIVTSATAAVRGSRAALARGGDGRAAHAVPDAECGASPKGIHVAHVVVDGAVDAPDTLGSPAWRRRPGVARTPAAAAARATGPAPRRWPPASGGSADAAVVAPAGRAVVAADLARAALGAVQRDRHAVVEAAHGRQSAVRVEVPDDGVELGVKCSPARRRADAPCGCRRGCGRGRTGCARCCGTAFGQRALMCQERRRLHVEHRQRRHADVGHP